MGRAGPIYNAVMTRPAIAVDNGLVAAQRVAERGTQDLPAKQRVANGLRNDIY
jgi:hypothetical protein